MSLRGWLFAALYDRMCAHSEQAGLATMRERLVGEASGDVLEIGAGTGANLVHYGDAVVSLALTDPEPAMLKRLQRQVATVRPSARVEQAPAEALPFRDESFDTLVSTLVLCGVEDQERALAEMRRVLRPDGRLLFLEHVRSEDVELARLQDRMNGINRLLAGCECNRSTLTAIRAAGFSVPRPEQDRLPRAPRFLSPLILGTAHRPAS